MSNEQLRGIEQQAVTSYEDEVLARMENWFPEGRIEVIDQHIRQSIERRKLKRAA